MAARQFQSWSGRYVNKGAQDAGTGREFQGTDGAYRVFEEAAAAGGFVPYPNPRYAMTAGHQPMDGGMQ